MSDQDQRNTMVHDPDLLDLFLQFASEGQEAELGPVVLDPVNPTEPSEDELNAMMAALLDGPLDFEYGAFVAEQQDDPSDFLSGWNASEFKFGTLPRMSSQPQVASAPKSFLFSWGEGDSVALDAPMDSSPGWQSTVGPTNNNLTSQLHELSLESSNVVNSQQGSRQHRPRGPIGSLRRQFPTAAVRTLPCQHAGCACTVPAPPTSSPSPPPPRQTLQQPPVGLSGMRSVHEFLQDAFPCLLAGMHTSADLDGDFEQQLKEIESIFESKLDLSTIPLSESSSSPSKSSSHSRGGGRQRSKNGIRVAFKTKPVQHKRFQARLAAAQNGARTSVLELHKVQKQNMQLKSNLSALHMAINGAASFLAKLKLANAQSLSPDSVIASTLPQSTISDLMRASDMTTYRDAQPSRYTSYHTALIKHLTNTTLACNNSPDSSPALVEINSCVTAASCFLRNLHILRKHYPSLDIAGVKPPHVPPPDPLLPQVARALNLTPSQKQDIELAINSLAASFRRRNLQRIHTLTNCLSWTTSEPPAQQHGTPTPIPAPTTTPPHQASPCTQHPLTLTNTASALEATSPTPTPPPPESPCAHTLVSLTNLADDLAYQIERDVTFLVMMSHLQPVQAARAQAAASPLCVDAVQLARGVLEHHMADKAEV